MYAYNIYIRYICSHSVLNKHVYLPPEVVRGTVLFSREGRIFCQCHEVFFRMYLSLVLEVYNRLFIDSLGFMVVDKIKKYQLGLTQL